MRAVVVLVFLAIAAFCAIGFAATFEPMEDGSPWAWRVGYGAVGLLCLARALYWLRGGRRRPD